MIELDGISRTYVVGDRPVHALRDVTLRFPPGDYVSVMGPSGSGKSTLLNVLGCLDRPDRGSYRIGGREVARLSEAERTLLRRHRIGFVFQTFHLVPRLSALENVALPMVFAGVPRGEREERARKALDSVGLSPRAEHRPEQLSGGERQRVAMARAVVMGPSILLADEPTGNLDSDTGRRILDLLVETAHGGATLLVVTHDLELARRAAVRVVRLADGRVAADDGGEKP